MICLQFHRKITYQRKLLRFWREKYSTQNTFKGLENEATFSWNGLLPTLIVKEKKNQDKFVYIFPLLEHFSTYVAVSIYDKDLFWERAIQKSRIELYNLSIYIYMIFSQQEQDIFYWNFCFFFYFWQALWQSSSTFRATILRCFYNVASRLACKPHLGEIQ